MAQNTYDIPELTTGNGLAELNSNFNLVETYLSKLDSTVNQQFSKSSIVLYNQPVAAGVGYGCLVYYDADASCFAPAIAKLKPAPGDQGESIEASEARVAGLVIDEPSGTSLTSNILIGGFFKGANIASSCFTGELAGTAGVYYLSPVEAGKAVHEGNMPSGHLRQPVLTYYGDGSLCMSLYYQAQDNHFHSSATLGSNWEDAGALASDLGITAPSEATYGYRMDPSINPECLALGSIAPDITAVFYNGMLNTKAARSIWVNGGRYVQDEASNGKAMYAWTSETSALGRAIYTNSASPTAGDPAYSDRRTTPFTAYVITSVSDDTLTIYQDATSYVYTRAAIADVYSYAWKLGGTRIFTWDAYPDTGESAYSDINCLSEVGSVTTAYGEQFIIADNVLWCKLVTPPDPGSVTLFNHYPFAYGSSVVRTVTSTNPGLLGVTLLNGNCELSPHDWVIGTTTSSPRAISAISDNIIDFTPVVPGIQAGPGISLSTLADGTAVISSNASIGQIQDAYSLMHNGTAVSSDGTYQYILFPKNRESEVIATLPVPSNMAKSAMVATLWLMPVGDGATLSISMTFIADPSATTNTPMPATMTQLGDLNINGMADYVSFAETATSLTVHSGGLLVARIHRAAASSDFKLIRLGFRLRIDDSGAADNLDSPAVSTGMYGTGVAGTSISANTAIMIGPQGTLVPCASSVASNADMCLGIAINGGPAGSDITYMYLGVLSGLSGIGAGAPVYIGESGNLATSRTPGMAFIQRIGIGLSSDQLQVSLGTAIIQEG